MKYLPFSLVLLVIAFCSANLTSQTWYNPGETYVFQSLSGNDSTQAVQIQVVVDSAGVATLSQSYHTASGTDQIRGYFRGQQGHWSFSDNALSISAQSPSYFLVSFDDLQAETINVGTVTVSCPCKAGSSAEAVCSVSIVASDGGRYLNLGCVPALSCNSCDKPVVSSVVLGDFSQGFLVLQATSVVIE